MTLQHTPTKLNFSKTLSMAHLDLGQAPPHFPLPLLRKIVSSVVGKFNDSFHNHDLDTGKVIYRQPYIYYYQKENGHFCLTAVDKGVSILKEWFQVGAPVNYNQTEMSWRSSTSEFYELEHCLKVHPENIPHQYSIHNYLALNTKNWPRFKKLRSKNQQKAFLANILSQHIHTFARSFEWEIPPFVNVCHIEDFRYQPVKNHDKVKGLQAFEILFHSPLQLPDSLFFGKRSSLGFGQLKKHLF